MPCALGGGHTMSGPADVERPGFPGVRAYPCFCLWRGLDLALVTPHRATDALDMFSEGMGKLCLGSGTVPAEASQASCPGPPLPRQWPPVTLQVWGWGGPSPGLSV